MLVNSRLNLRKRLISRLLICLLAAEVLLASTGMTLVICAEPSKRSIATSAGREAHAGCNGAHCACCAAGDSCCDGCCCDAEPTASLSEPESAAGKEAAWSSMRLEWRSASCTGQKAWLVLDDQAWQSNPQVVTKWESRLVCTEAIPQELVPASCHFCLDPRPPRATVLL